MSVDQTGVVDAIGVDKLLNEVILTISDQLEWNDQEHFILLQNKLNTYLSFVESEELFDIYPDSKNRKVVINIICKYSPNQQAIHFLGQVKSIIENAGILFRYEIYISS